MHIYRSIYVYSLNCVTYISTLIACVLESCFKCYILSLARSTPVVYIYILSNESEKE